MSSDERYEIPIFGECVIGYRAWIADERDQLWPISSDRRPWPPGVNTARCNCATWDSLRLEWSVHQGRRVLEPAPEHAAPLDACDCGLYSWRRPETEWSEDPSQSSPPEIVGAVASWGAIQVHNDGFRAEHACIVTLAHHAEVPADSLAVLRRIARRYRVELVLVEELESAARRHGAPLADDLRPPQASVTEAPEDDQPAAPVPRAPDATVDEIGTPRPYGFNGKPLKESSSLYGGGTGM